MRGHPEVERLREDDDVTFTLDVDAPRWRAQLDGVLEREPRTVPVLKGNGYGFGNARLAAEAARLKVDVIAVGTVHDLAEVRGAESTSHYAGDALVLTPWHPASAGGDRTVDGDPRLIRTVSHAEAVLELAQREPGARVVIEVLTSMRRHGVTPRDLALLLRPLESLQVEGFALHLPLDRDGDDDAVDEIDRWTGMLADASLHPRTLWVSHLTTRELAQARAFLPGADIRPRVGTNLWLGDRSAFGVSATVLDLHPVKRGDRVGYRQRKAPKDGHVLVVSGGTAHGVGLEAPSAAAGLKGRGRVAARGGLEAAGWSASPFTLDGHRLRFAEPPHMQVSMLWLPQDRPTPRIGDRLDCRVRMTTASFDAIVGL
jgi:alanine racemase